MKWNYCKLSWTTTIFDVDLFFYFLTATTNACHFAGLTRTEMTDFNMAARERKKKLWCELVFGYVNTRHCTALVCVFVALLLCSLWLSRFPALLDSTNFAIIMSIYSAGFEFPIFESERIQFMKNYIWNFLDWFD